MKSNNNLIFMRGFTLVEMAIVLIVVGLMMGSFLIPLSAQMNQSHNAENQRRMLEIKEVMIGYAMKNGYLPCPAKSFNDGAEDRNVSGECNKRSGFIPWLEIGVNKADIWGHLYLYSVTSIFAQGVPLPKITLSTNPDITIKTRDASGALVNLSNPNTVPFVIVSMGKNSNFSFKEDGTVTSNLSINGTNVDEISNSVGTKVFVSRVHSNNPSTDGGEFDDMLVWAPIGLYINKMISAQQLP